MADVLTKEQRQLNMTRIRGRDTIPELLLRRGLHGLGLRFRLYRKDLPGKPDLVFPRHRAVILVHGCFWHWHNCPLFKWPATRATFWRQKIERNRKRDQASVDRLIRDGWRVLIVWECALRGSGKRDVGDCLRHCERFVKGREQTFGELSGDWPVHIVSRTP